MGKYSVVYALEKVHATLLLGPFSRESCWRAKVKGGHSREPRGHEKSYIMVDYAAKGSECHTSLVTDVFSAVSRGEDPRDGFRLVPIGDSK